MAFKTIHWEATFPEAQYLTQQKYRFPRKEKKLMKKLGYRFSIHKTEHLDRGQIRQISHIAKQFHDFMHGAEGAALAIRKMSKKVRTVFIKKYGHRII